MEEEKQERNKGGRPKKEQKRVYKIGLAFSLVEKTLVQEKAKRSGINPAEYVRKMAVSGKVKPRPTAEEMQQYRDFTGIANNLNQLTKEAHQQNFAVIVPRLLKTLEEINKAIKFIHDSKNENG